MGPGEVESAAAIKNKNKKQKRVDEWLRNAFDIPVLAT
jgi:hypothetical protein